MEIKEPFGINWAIIHYEVWPDIRDLWGTADIKNETCLADEDGD